MPCKVVLEPVRSADTLGEAVTQAERAEAARLPRRLSGATNI